MAIPDPWTGGLLSFAAGYVLLVMAPGPNFLVVAQASLSLSGRASLSAVTGIAAGASLLSAVVALGFMSLPDLAVLSRWGPFLFAWILIYSGLRTLGRCFAASPLSLAPPSLLARRFFRLGFLTAFANPVTAAFFGASLPGLAGQDDFAVTRGVAAVVFLSALLWFGALGLLLSSPPIRARYNRYWRQVDGCLGLLLIAAGAAASTGMLDG